MPDAPKADSKPTARPNVAAEVQPVAAADTQPSTRQLATTIDYDFYDLTELTGATLSPVDFEGGYVAGTANEGSSTRAFRWHQSEGLLVLDNPAGSARAFGDAINAAGQVVGYAVIDNASVPVTWAVDGTPIRIPTLGGDWGRALGIDASGAIVGSSSITGPNPIHAFRWDGENAPQDLGTVGGGTFAQAWDINDVNGWIVGAGHNASGVQRAFLWRPGESELIDLGSFLDGGSSIAFGVNSRGQIVGEAQTGHFRGRAYIWTEANGMVALPGDGATEVAFDINEAGQIVGYSANLVDPLLRTAVLWQDGVLVDLNELAPSGWYLTEARAIDEDGSIVGVGTLEGANRAFLLRANQAPPSACEAFRDELCLDEGFEPATGLSDAVFQVEGNVEHLPDCAGDDCNECGEDGFYRIAQGGVLKFRTSALPAPGMYRVSVQARAIEGDGRLDINGGTRVRQSLVESTGFTWTEPLWLELGAGEQTIQLENLQESAVDVEGVTVERVCPDAVYPDSIELWLPAPRVDYKKADVVTRSRVLGFGCTLEEEPEYLLDYRLQMKVGRLVAGRPAVYPNLAALDNIPEGFYLVSATTFGVTHSAPGRVTTVPGVFDPDSYAAVFPEHRWNLRASPVAIELHLSNLSQDTPCGILATFILYDPEETAEQRVAQESEITSRVVPVLFEIPRWQMASEWVSEPLTDAPGGGPIQALAAYTSAYPDRSIIQLIWQGDKLYYRYTDLNGVSTLWYPVADETNAAPEDDWPGASSGSVTAMSVTRLGRHGADNDTLRIAFFRGDRGWTADVSAFSADWETSSSLNWQPTSETLPGYALGGEYAQPVTAHDVYRHDTSLTEEIWHGGLFHFEREIALDAQGFPLSGSATPWSAPRSNAELEDARAYPLSDIDPVEAYSMVAIEPCLGCGARTTLHEQMGTSSYGSTSQDFTNAGGSLDAFDNAGADDFLVPAGSRWEVESVEAAGHYEPAFTRAEGFNVFFHDDSGHASPGAIVCSYTDLTPNVDDGARVQFELPTPCSLSEGRKWVSVQAKAPFSGEATGIQWYWHGNVTQRFAAAHWRNPGNGYGHGCTDWVPRTSCIPSEYPDNGFRLQGRTDSALISLDVSSPTLALNDEGWPAPNPVTIGAQLGCPADAEQDCSFPFRLSLGSAQSPRFLVFDRDLTSDGPIPVTCTETGLDEVSQSSYEARCSREGAGTSLRLAPGETKRMSWRVWIQPSDVAQLDVTAEWGSQVDRKAIDIPRAQIRPVVLLPGAGTTQPPTYTQDNKFLWLANQSFGANYNALYAAYEKLGYEMDVTLFQFPYDWLRSNMETALRLRDDRLIPSAITAASRPWVLGAPDPNRVELDLIGHSTGNLVARAYLQGPHWIGNVGKYVSIAAPHRGVPKAYGDFEGIRPGFNFLDLTTFYLWAPPRARAAGYGRLVCIPFTSICRWTWNDEDRYQFGHDPIDGINILPEFLPVYDDGRVHLENLNGVPAMPSGDFPYGRMANPLLDDETVLTGSLADAQSGQMQGKVFDPYLHNPNVNSVPSGFQTTYYGLNSPSALDLFDLRLDSVQDNVCVIYGGTANSAAPNRDTDVGYDVKEPRSSSPYWFNGEREFALRDIGDGLIPALSAFPNLAWPRGAPPSLDVDVVLGSQGRPEAVHAKMTGYDVTIQQAVLCQTGLAIPHALLPGFSSGEPQQVTRVASSSATVPPASLEDLTDRVLVITSTSPVEMTLSDSQGRRLGYGGTPGSPDLEEIPNGLYLRDEGSGQTHLLVYGSEAGGFNLTVHGTGDPYTVLGSIEIDGEVENLFVDESSDRLRSFDFEVPQTLEDVPVPPVVDAGLDQSGEVGVPLHFAGSFTDPNPLDTHTISWDFGDGETAEDSLQTTHTYAAAGTYRVVLTVTDNAGFVGSDELVVRINHPPVAMDDSYIATVGKALLVRAEGGVLANDVDEDGDPLTARLVSPPTRGSLSLEPDGSFRYTPSDAGVDSFTYVAADALSSSEPATVTIENQTDNEAPVARDDSYRWNGSQLLKIAAPGVLGNDLDADGDALEAILLEPPARGSVSLNADGGFVYRPAWGQIAADRFTYVASDGKKRSAPATVEILPGSDCEELYGIDTDRDVLFRLDPQTGEAGIVGPLGIHVESGGLDFDAKGRLWGFSRAENRLDRGLLYRIDLETGRARVVRKFKLSGWIGDLGIEFGPDGKTLFLISDGRLAILDTRRGRVRPFAKLPFRGEALALPGACEDFFSYDNGAGRLVRIGPTDGRTEPLRPSGLTDDIASLAATPGGTLYGYGAGKLYRFDRMSGKATPLGALDDLSFRASGLAARPPYARKICLDTDYQRKTNTSRFVVKTKRVRHVDRCKRLDRCERHGKRNCKVCKPEPCGRCGDRGYYQMMADGTMTVRTPRVPAAGAYRLQFQVRVPEGKTSLVVRAGKEKFRLRVKGSSWQWTEPVVVFLEEGRQWLTLSNSYGRGSRRLEIEGMRIERDCDELCGGKN